MQNAFAFSSGSLVFDSLSFRRVIFLTSNERWRQGQTFLLASRISEQMLVAELRTFSSRVAGAIRNGPVASSPSTLNVNEAEDVVSRRAAPARKNCSE